MKDYPDPCRVAGDAVRAPSGYDVHVRSHFGGSEVKEANRQAREKGYIRPFFGRWLQYVPIIGRLAAHATTNYWVSHRLIAPTDYVLHTKRDHPLVQEQLERIGLLPCVREE